MAATKRVPGPTSRDSSDADPRGRRGPVTAPRGWSARRLWHNPARPPNRSPCAYRCFVTLFSVWVKPNAPAFMPEKREDGVRHLQDLELARRALAGDNRAVEDFVTRMSCVRRFLRFKNASFGSPLNSQELEDATQDTLMALWRKLGEFRGQGKLESWAYRFSYLELMNHLQSRDRRPKYMDELPEQVGPDPTEEGVDPLEIEKVYRGIERLEETAADVIQLKHLDSLTFEEIGARLSLSVNTVKTRYYRGMRKLRELLPGDPAREEGTV